MVSSKPPILRGRIMSRSVIKCALLKIESFKQSFSFGVFKFTHYINWKKDWKLGMWKFILQKLGEAISEKTRSFVTGQLASQPNRTNRIPRAPSSYLSPTLECCVGAAHANDPERSPAGYVLTRSSGTIPYLSNEQAMTAPSLTAAEFIAAVIAAKSIDLSAQHSLNFLAQYHQ